MASHTIYREAGCVQHHRCGASGLHIAPANILFTAATCLGIQPVYQTRASGPRSRTCQGARPCPSCQRRRVARRREREDLQRRRLGLTADEVVEDALEQLSIDNVAGRRTRPRSFKVAKMTMLRIENEKLSIQNSTNQDLKML